jgi:DNA-binding IclR family transcriptional regulator
MEVADGGPRHHRTIDRVTQILEEVVYNPGIGFAELARALGAPRSSVHGFIRGLQANGWLYEENRRFYLGPAVYGLTIASGQIRAGQVSQEDLDALHDETGMTVFLGVEAGDDLFYVGDSGSGSDALTSFAARSNIRRELISTAGGKVLLASRPDAELDAYLRRKQAEQPELVSQFLAELPEIRKTGVAVNLRHQGAQLSLATIVRSGTGAPVATAIIVGEAARARRRQAKLRDTLLRHANNWSRREVAPREAI